MEIDSANWLDEYNSEDRCLEETSLWLKPSCTWKYSCRRGDGLAVVHAKAMKDQETGNQ